MSSRIYSTICMITAITITGCSDIVIKVNKKSKSDSALSEQQPSISDKDVNALTLADVESYIKDVDKVKGDVGAYIIKKLNDDYRSELRSAIRDFRKNLVTSVDGMSPLAVKNLDKIKDSCGDLEASDLQVLKIAGGLAIILEASLLSKLDSSSIKVPEGSTISLGSLKQMGANEKLALFELGIEAKGESSIEETSDRIIKTSNIRWKIVTETTDLDGLSAEEQENLKDLDKQWMGIQFARTTTKDAKPLSLTLKVAIGSEAEVAAMDAFTSYFFQVDSKSEDGKYHLLATAGFAETTTFSRKMTFAESPENKDHYIFVDTINYNLAGESTHMSLIKFDEIKQCAVDAKDAAGDIIDGIDPSSDQKPKSNGGSSDKGSDDDKGAGSSDDGKSSGTDAGSKGGDTQPKSTPSQNDVGQNDVSQNK